jgi:Tol biopolymer transport system component
MSINKTLLLTLLSFAVLSSFAGVGAPNQQLRLPAEKHLKNLRQLSFAGENAEAYFSADGQQLIFQSKRDDHECDQIYTMNVDGSNVRLISNGEGRTTCSYFFPNGRRVLYSSTYLGA